MCVCVCAHHMELDFEKLLQNWSGRVQKKAASFPFVQGPHCLVLLSPMEQYTKNKNQKRWGHASASCSTPAFRAWLTFQGGNLLVLLEQSSLIFCPIPHPPVKETRTRSDQILASWSTSYMASVMGRCYMNTPQRTHSRIVL